MEIATNQRPQFTSNLIEHIMQMNKIHHKKSAPYHPQANGQVEVTNRELENIIIETINMHKKDWAKKLIEFVWANNTTWKTTIRFTPYEFVYGKKEMLPIEFKITTLKTASYLNLDLSSTQEERF